VKDAAQLYSVPSSFIEVSDALEGQYMLHHMLNSYLEFFPDLNRV